MRLPSLVPCLSAAGALALAACATTPAPPPPQPAEGAREAAAPAPAEPAAPAPAALDFSLPQEESQEPAEMLRRRAEEQSLAVQRTAVLVERHLERARELRDALRLEDAEREALEALRLDPDNREARELASSLGAMLGRRPGEVETFRREIERQWELRLQALRAEALEALARGRAALDRDEPDRAIEEFTIVLSHVRWAPTGFDGDALAVEARAGIERARAEREASAERDRLRRDRTAFERLREEEAKETRRREALLDTILLQAIEAFEAGRHDEAVALAERALREDPRNARAEEIRGAAFKAGLEGARADYVARRREEFRRWRESLLETRAPHTEVVTLPDREFWEDISRRRAARWLEGFAAAETAESMRLREALASSRIPSLQVRDETDLRNVVEHIRTFTGLPLVVDQAAVQKVDEAGVTFNLNIQHPLSAADALRLLLEYAGGEVTSVIRHDVILVTTKEKARGAPVVRNHDIQDLVFGLTTFIGPRIGEIRLPGAGFGFGAAEEDVGIFGGTGEAQEIVNPDELVTLIKDTIAPGTWDEEGHAIDHLQGNLIVVHDVEVQRQVARFLDDLRRFAGALVTIEAKFLTVSENFLQSIGVDFRGLGGETGTLANLDDVTNGLEDQSSQGFDNSGPGLGTGASNNPSSGLFFNEGGDSEFRARTENFFDTPLGKTLSTTGGLTFQFTLLDDAELSLIFRAVEKRADFQVVNSQVVSVHNTQRAYLTVVNQTTYIQDFDVEVAQASFIADPSIGVIPDGVVLDVRPTIHHDRKYLTLELRPTVATLLRPLFNNPQFEFSSTLGGGSQTVTFQLPELKIQSAATTIVVPDGGSVLIGGLKEIRSVDRRASVPWLDSIPLVSALFKKEEQSEETRELLLLIRAWMTDVKEEAKKIAVR